MNLQVSTESIRDWVVVKPEGEIDIASSGVLREAIDAALGDGCRRLAVDLMEVSFMDSTGLRTLIEANERMIGREGELVVVVSGGPVDRLFDITGLRHTLQVRDSLPSEAE